MKLKLLLYFHRPGKQGPAGHEGKFVIDLIWPIWNLYKRTIIFKNLGPPGEKGGR